MRCRRTLISLAAALALALFSVGSFVRAAKALKQTSGGKWIASTSEAKRSELQPHRAQFVYRPRPDFNGDRFADFVVGTPGEDLGGIENAGAVHIIYGSPGGLSSDNNQVWTQDSPGIEDVAEENDGFGFELTWGDFNGDGFDDLAVGAFLEDLGAGDNEGAVHVIYGSSAGLTAAGNQFWTQDTGRIEDQAELHDAFGQDLTTGDLNGDGFDDLVVGVIHEDLRGPNINVEQGAVHVIYGSAAGVTDAGNQLWTQDSPSVKGGANPGDFFGSGLAVGDFNGDGFFDLAIGVPGEHIGDIIGAGAVNILYGSSAGITAAGNQFWSQNSAGILDAAEEHDVWGVSLVSNDFNNDRFMDLAVAGRSEDVGTVRNAGAVNVLYGSSVGLRAPGNQFWTQDSPGVLDGAEPGDGFGNVTTARDFNGDGFRDLAIGVSEEDLESTSETLLFAGAVSVIYGSSSGLSASGNQFWTQDSPGVGDIAEAGDVFGRVLTGGDYNGDRIGDLAISASDESVFFSGGGARGEIPAAGAVNVIYGSSSGLSAPGNQFWTQDSPGILDQAERQDLFGRGLANR